MNDVQIIIRFHLIHLADFDGVIYGTRAHVHTMTIYFHQWKSCLRFNKITFKEFYLCDIMSRDTHKKSEPVGWLSIMWNVCSSGENYYGKGCESWNCFCCCCSLLLYFSANWTICTIRFGRGPCYAGRYIVQIETRYVPVGSSLALHQVKLNVNKREFRFPIFFFFSWAYFFVGVLREILFTLKNWKRAKVGVGFYGVICVWRGLFFA